MEVKDYILITFIFLFLAGVISGLVHYFIILPYLKGQTEVSKPQITKNEIKQFINQATTRRIQELKSQIEEQIRQRGPESDSKLREEINKNIKSELDRIEKNIERKIVDFKKNVETGQNITFSGSILDKLKEQLVEDIDNKIYTAVQKALLREDVKKILRQQMNAQLKSFSIKYGEETRRKLDYMEKKINKDIESRFAKINKEIDMGRTSREEIIHKLEELRKEFINVTKQKTSKPDASLSVDRKLREQAFKRRQ